jgi:hypothetical protein
LVGELVELPALSTADEGHYCVDRIRRRPLIGAKSFECVSTLKCIGTVHAILSTPARSGDAVIDIRGCPIVNSWFSWNGSETS